MNSKQIADGRRDGRSRRCGKSRPERLGFVAGDWGLPNPWSAASFRGRKQFINMSKQPILEIKKSQRGFVEGKQILKGVT
jgi:hypothetical protein